MEKEDAVEVIYEILDKYECKNVEECTEELLAVILDYVEAGKVDE